MLPTGVLIQGKDGIGTPSLVFQIESHSAFPGRGKERAGMRVLECSYNGGPSTQEEEEQGLIVPSNT